LDNKVIDIIDTRL